MKGLVATISARARTPHRTILKFAVAVLLETMMAFRLLRVEQGKVQEQIQSNLTLTIVTFL